jgi:maltose alpha-D-glucosyltransferase/alpha-amylase
MVARATATPRVEQAPSLRMRGEPRAGAPADAWYKHAIIYELHVRAFQDSNNDGVGDFPGLTSRLDYLRDLGVTAIWLLPFYPSPLRDDGYDIADYKAVHPAYGTMRDFRRFVDEAHRRDLRVITELVINHTSDQHPWFQRARRAPKGSTERDFYVWSDTPEKYPGVRVIFQDTETSNWTLDPVAGEHYWHRFFRHQPDLNYDNPAVRDAVFDVMDFWFEAGVDGMRLDAVPYLFEREGTNCENLPETHEMLRRLRRHVDARWPGRMLLGEANQWPEDAIAYFGDGDECHMNFHFPLMPRLFMALRMEDRYPVVDILEQTPPLPEGAQWAIFLRNHDELTLEMVTDEERDYMYRVYAHDRQMRINVGIRRRLAPLLSNNRRKIELMNGLLMSLPGTPVLYYGDEIGMGDNVYLGDRDSVRTPMQWSGDRNAGFSRANPHSLYLPVIIDPEYHYEALNVESQQANPSSLLSWTKRLLALRRRHPAMAGPDIEFLHPSNPKALAYLRQSANETILVVANLSRFVQPVELDLRRFEGATPVELFGFTRFPQIGELPYFLTLAPHSFYWFRLERAESSLADPEAAPTIDLNTSPAEWLRGDTFLRFVRDALPALLPARRWFSGKARRIREVAPEEFIDLGVLDDGAPAAALCLVRVSYTEGDDDRFTLPVAILEPERALTQRAVQPAAALATLEDRAGERRYVLTDASGDEAFWRRTADLVRTRGAIEGVRGTLEGVRVEQPPSPSHERAPGHSVRVLRAEQSNSSAVLDDASILKLFRRVEPGVNPDVEIGAHLTRQRRFTHTPATEGWVQYTPARGEPVTVAVQQAFVPNEGDAWRFTVDAVGRYFDRVAALRDGSPTFAEGDPLDRAATGPTPEEVDLLNGHLELAELLGRRTGELHTALADSDDPAFAPEPSGKLYQRALYQSLRSGVQRPLQELQARLATLSEEDRALAQQLLARRDQIFERIEFLRHGAIDSARIRCHGDFHLGQALWTGEDFIIIDFEGEPMRSIGERRIKRSCLLDVAGMLRSLDYAAHAGMREAVARGVSGGVLDAHAHQRWADAWSTSAAGAFLRGYLPSVDPRLVPADPTLRRSLLHAWMLHKAAYEVRYELNNRPDWVGIPLRGMLRIVEPHARPRGRDDA